MLQVVAAILKKDDSYLLALRPSNKHQGGKWEFPGGKVEPGESRIAALCRECYEELGISIDTNTKDAPVEFDYVEFDYGDKEVAITFYLVEGFSNAPTGSFGKERQTVRWFTSEELNHLEFPAANKRAVSKLAETPGAAISS